MANPRLSQRYVFARLLAIPVYIFVSESALVAVEAGWWADESSLPGPIWIPDDWISTMNPLVR